MNILRYAVPSFLILFTLCSLYVFFLGKNGLSSHEEKKKHLLDLQKSTELLKKRIEIVQKKRWNLEKMEESALEELARGKSLKKVGEKLIVLKFRDQLREKARDYEKYWIEKQKASSNFLNFDHRYWIWGTVLFSFLVLIGLSGFLGKKQSE